LVYTVFWFIAFSLRSRFCTLLRLPSPGSRLQHIYVCLVKCLRFATCRSLAHSSHYNTVTFTCLQFRFMFSPFSVATFARFYLVAVSRHFRLVTLGCCRYCLCGSFYACYALLSRTFDSAGLLSLPAALRHNVCTVRSFAHTRTFSFWTSPFDALTSQFTFGWLVILTRVYAQHLYPTWFGFVLRSRSPLPLFTLHTLLHSRLCALFTFSVTRFRLFTFPTRSGLHVSARWLPGFATVHVSLVTVCSPHAVGFTYSHRSHSRARFTRFARRYVCLTSHLRCARRSAHQFWFTDTARSFCTRLVPRSRFSFT